MSQNIICPSKVKAKYPTVFLAGSIEMNRAEDWQTKIQDMFARKPVTFYNPRRKDWNSDWAQTLEEENFVIQVEWELVKLEICDVIFMSIDPKTLSPITLLEFGMHVKANPEKLVVHCPEGFWKKGNLQVTGRMYGVKIHDDLESAIEHMESLLGNAAEKKRKREFFKAITKNAGPRD